MNSVFCLLPSAFCLFRSIDGTDFDFGETRCVQRGLVGEIIGRFERRGLKLVGAAPGTIRGDLGMEIGRNLVHGSDGPETAVREVTLFFTDAELVTWDRISDPWIRE